ncbi:MAG: hypothetical protein JW785_00465 [Acidimicrobiia bacterium]|nr:hypothetical protein [Acidimicrobiia bacterium]
MRRMVRLFVAAAFGVSLLAASAGAQAEAGGRLPPLVVFDTEISGAPGDQQWPAIAWNATDNEYLVVWQDTRNLGTRGHDIYGRRLDALGSPIGADFRISGPQALKDEYEPAVAWSRMANRYLVVWRDGRDLLGKGDEIFGRVLAADGTPVGGDKRISSPKATQNEYQPDIVWNQTSGRFLVVWMDGRNLGSRGWDVYGRLVKTDGKPSGRDRRISGPRATSNEGRPAVAWDQTGNRYLVVWEDERGPVARGQDIYGRLLNSNLQPIGGDHRISGPKATSDEHEPDVAWNGSAGRHVVVWRDERNDGTTGDDIYGRVVGTNGRPVGGDKHISSPAAVANEYRPAVACHQATGSCLVVWDDGRDQLLRGFDIIGRRIGADGKATGGELQVSGTAATSDESTPALACSQDDNRYLVVWQDWRNDGYPLYHGIDLYGRRVSG